MVSSMEKTQFWRKATEDMESMSSVYEVMASEALLIGEILISLNCSTVSLTLPTIFKSKKVKGRPSRGRRATPYDKGRCGPRWGYHIIL